MSKKIKSYKELLEKIKDCKELIDIRKKWGANPDAIKVIVSRNGKTVEAIERAEIILSKVMDYVEVHKITDISISVSEFTGYSGIDPSVEIVYKGKGNIVFGNVTIDTVEEILYKYLIDQTEIENFFKKIEM